MNWLDSIRKQPHHKKIRLIWTITIVAFVFLVAVWITSYKFQKKTAHDTTLFDTIGRGFYDLQTNIKDIPGYIQSQNK